MPYILASALIAALAFVSLSAAAQVVVACVNISDGAVRVVSSPADCRPHETTLSWNQAGPTGPQGPAGARGATGPQGPSGQQGADGLGAGAFFSLGDLSTPILYLLPNNAFALANRQTGSFARITLSETPVRSDPLDPSTELPYLRASHVASVSHPVYFATSDCSGDVAYLNVILPSGGSGPVEYDALKTNQSFAVYERVPEHSRELLDSIPQDSTITMALFERQELLLESAPVNVRTYRDVHGNCLFLNRPVTGLLRLTKLGSATFRNLLEWRVF